MLLSANVGFLAINSIDVDSPNKSAAQIASYISAILSLPRSTAHPFPLNALLLVDLVRCQAQHNLDSITSIAHLHALQSIRGERHLHRCARAHELVELLLELFVLLGGEEGRRGGEAGERGSKGNEGAGAPRSLPGPALG